MTRRNGAELLRTLRSGRFGTVSGLVGTSWQRYVRILHPARRADLDGLVAVAWRDVATASGRDFDPARATWFDVSGRRPHTGNPSPGADFEPDVGPGDPKLQSAVVSALVAAAGDQSLWIAQWVGYGDGSPSPILERVRVGREVFALEEIAPAEFPVAQTRSNYVCGDTGRWLLHANMDCMSTYVGLSAGLHVDWPRDLEVTPVLPTQTVS